MNKNTSERLEYLRGEIISECISVEELSELQSLAEFIAPHDVLLREWAGLPEFPSDDELLAYIPY